MKKFFTTKRFVWMIVIVLILGSIVYAIVRPKNNTGQILTDKVARQDLKQTVLATGQVTSQTDLDLSFKSSGIVTSVRVAVGDKVEAGQILAILDQSDQQAALTTARGALAQAQANYQKVITGAGNEDIALAQKGVAAAQTTLNNAKKSLDDATAQEQVLVANAYRTLLNTGLAATPATSNINTSDPTISGTYTGTQGGTYTIREQGTTYSVAGLEDGPPTYISTVTPQPLGSKGLYVTFPSGYKTGYDTWTVSIPNTNSSSYVTDYNAYQAALQTQTVALSSAQAAVDSSQAALDQQTAQLNLKTAQAQPADVASAQAQILSAEGQVQTAQSALDNTVLRAPAKGTITSVDVKAGELATALKEVVILQDIDNLHIEANISEANISAISAGQSIDVTFDAFGPDRHYQATVQSLDPASTIISGVVNYKLTATIAKDPDIKPGLTANMQILTAEKPNALAIPQRAILDRDGKKYVRVITDAASKKYEEREITVGLQADGGLQEVTSGLSEGQEIVTFIGS